jgi:hypothetical protein
VRWFKIDLNGQSPFEQNVFMDFETTNCLTNAAAIPQDKSSNSSFRFTSFGSLCHTQMLNLYNDDRLRLS